MEKFSELKQRLDEASKNLAQLEKHITYFKSSLDVDFVMSAGSVHFMPQYAGSMQVNGKNYQAIASEGRVKGVVKLDHGWLVYADLFGHTITAMLDDDEYEQFLEVCKNAR